MFPNCVRFWVNIISAAQRGDTVVPETEVNIRQNTTRDNSPKPGCSAFHCSPLVLRPIPNPAKPMTTRKRKLRKSEILTSTPIKEEQKQIYEKIGLGQVGLDPDPILILNCRSEVRNPTHSLKLSSRLNKILNTQTEFTYTNYFEFLTITNNMNQNNNENLVTVQQVKEPKPYRGRKENQKNPHAKHEPINKEPKSQQQTRKQPPLVLNKPTHKAPNDAAHPLPKSSNPAEGSVFISEISVRETRSRQTFTPSTPAAIEISRQTFAELLTDDTQLSKAILPEYQDYYTTCLIWFRITTLKQKNSQPLTAEEQAVLDMIQTTSFCVPTPIELQLRSGWIRKGVVQKHVYLYHGRKIRKILFRHSLPNILRKNLPGNGNASN
ncbi:hypothetical protein WA026_017676 [Henosepilachna vigintioctopunctata]|uniref:Uncharacterized protein n=1 Tax=Henosepilachna vigintioctopunctata TaxID=420089 RepID=A0AAW1U9L3_9CUCU